MSKSNSNHKIKVPIFSSEIIENQKGMFEEANYFSMIKLIKVKIDKFNLNKPIIKKSKFNKVKETQIAGIDYFDFDFESIPTLPRSAKSPDFASIKSLTSKTSKVSPPHAF